MPASTTFDNERAAVVALTHRWQLAKAYHAADALVVAYPNRPEAYALLNLIVCLTNGGPGKRASLHYRSALVIDGAIRNVPNFKGSITHGDMLRDQLFGLACFPTKDGLRIAAALPAQIEQMHRGRPNRLAALKDGRGRLAAAIGEPLKAYDWHAMAHQEWRRLGGDADVAWMYSNLARWLRTSLELFGTDYHSTRKVKAAIERLRSEQGTTGQARGGIKQLRLISLPIIGPRVHRWMETHRLLFG